MGPRMAYSVPNSLGARTRPTVVPQNLTRALFFPRQRIHFKPVLLLLARDSCCFPGMPQNMFWPPWVCPRAPSSVGCRCVRNRLPSNGWLIFRWDFCGWTLTCQVYFKFFSWRDRRAKFLPVLRTYREMGSSQWAGAAGKANPYAKKDGAYFFCQIQVFNCV